MRAPLRAAWSLSLFLLACGGGEPTRTGEVPAVAAGGEAPPPVEPADAPPPDGVCVDPEGGGYYLYLGRDALVLARLDGTRERLDVEDVEATTRAVARDELRARSPGPTVHLVTDDYADPSSAELVLRVLHDEGFTEADRCAPGPSSPHPSASDALYAE